jgi:taurine dioxygenase
LWCQFAQSLFAIDGLDQEQAQALMARLKAHATEPRFVYKHKYEVGDIALFDCLSTMHMATNTLHVPSQDHPDARLLWRLSTENLPLVIGKRAA